MRENFQRLAGWVKQHSLLLRLVFFGSILIFVVNQVINIAHGMSWEEVGQTLEAQQRLSLVLMAVLGFAGVLPMLGYDYVTIRVLEAEGRSKMPRGEWALSAWIVNTINNLAGFGGVVGASLRGSFYGKDNDKRKVLATVSKVALFMFTGLSLWAIFLAVEILILGHNPHFRSYWIWLVGGSLYAPALFVLSYVRRKQLFADLYPGGVVALILTSFAQWSGALLVFLGIGELMNLHLPLTEVYPMFLIATLIGMLTMVPGGMGTFDVMMILGMGQLGLSQGQTVVWLLFYRVFYYLLPFFSGLLLYISRTGVKFNRYFNNIPRIALQRFAHLVVIGAVYGAGIMMVLLSTVTNLSNLSHIFQVLLPYSFNFLDQTLNLLVGFLLLGLARALYAKVKRAFIPTILLLLFGIINTISRTRSLRLIVAYCVILLLVWLARKEFYRERFVYSWGALIFDGLLFGVLVVVYAVAGFHSGQWWNNDVLGGKFILFPSDEVWLSGLLGLGLALLTLLGLQQFLATTEQTLGEPLDTKRFNNLLSRYQGTLVSQRLLLPGYKYYYYRSDGLDRVVFGYQVKGNRCFVLGEPIGDKRAWREATSAFMLEADKLGYQLAFYKVSESYVVLLHDLGFQFSKVGENGIVDLYLADELNTQEQTRKFSYQGYSYSYYPQLPKEMYHDLRLVSDKWLAGQTEKNFAYGRFDVDYLALAGIGVLRNQQNKIVGFITEQPISQSWISYDLLRMDPQVPKELSNFLIINQLAVWRKAGYQKADLGLAPLANVGEGPSAFFRDRLMNLVYTYGNNFYDFQDNFSGKQTYVQEWQGCYFAYLNGGSFYLAAFQLLSLIGRGKSKGTTLVEEALITEELE